MDNRPLFRLGRYRVDIVNSEGKTLYGYQRPTAEAAAEKAERLRQNVLPLMRRVCGEGLDVTVTDKGPKFHEADIYL